MTNPQQPDDITVDNQNSLKILVRKIQLSQGQFGLTFMRCNDEALRDAMAQRLRELSPVPIREIVLSPSVTFFYTIKTELGDEHPDVLMVFGLESVNNLAALSILNQIRFHELDRIFPFLLLFWVNDEVLRKIFCLMPVLASYASPIIEFVSTKEEYL
jgi:hypothetical protein